MSTRPPDLNPRQRTATRRRNLAMLCSVGIAVGLVGTIVTAQHDSGLGFVSGQDGQRTYQVGNFEGVSTVGSADVEVSVGPAFSVRATGAGEALDRYDVSVEGGDLQIQPKNSAWWRGLTWSGAQAPTFYVTLPRLTSASLTGSGDMKINGVTGPTFAAKVSGSGGMDIASMAVDEAQLSLAGSGDMSASGKAANAHVSIAGSGDIQASGLASTTAEVSMTGSGDAALTVANTADVSIVGSGDVAIGGTAHCKVSRMGSGDVRCPS